MNGDELKQRGMTRALDAAHEEWKTAFQEVAERLADRGVPFTSEDIVAKVGLPSGDTGMNRNNAVGAVMSGLASRKIIVKTGKRVKARRSTSHSAELTEWVGVGGASRYRAKSPQAAITLIQRIEAVRRLHRSTSPLGGTCVDCKQPMPCNTAKLVM